VLIIHDFETQVIIDVIPSILSLMKHKNKLKKIRRKKKRKNVASLGNYENVSYFKTNKITIIFAWKTVQKPMNNTLFVLLKRKG